MNKKYKEIIHNMNVKIKKDIIRRKKKNIKIKLVKKDKKYYDKQITNK